MGSSWLWPGKRTFLEVASMVVARWIVTFLPSDCADDCNIINQRIVVNFPAFIYIAVSKGLFLIIQLITLRQLKCSCLSNFHHQPGDFFRTGLL